MEVIMDNIEIHSGQKPIPLNTMFTDPLVAKCKTLMERYWQNNPDLHRAVQDKKAKSATINSITPNLSDYWLRVMQQYDPQISLLYLFHENVFPSEEVISFTKIICKQCAKISILFIIGEAKFRIGSYL